MISYSPTSLDKASHETYQDAWFCVQTCPKHEHIAMCGLAKVGGFEVFNPKMRIRRATRRGLVWFNESAFPGYIFVRFNLQLDINAVRYSPSVTRVVHFRSGYPSIPDKHVDELKAIFGPDSTIVVDTDISIGDLVRVVSGAFHDVVAIVQEVRPAKQRVMALLEFLGRATTVELDIRDIVVEQHCPALPHLLNPPAVSGGGLHATGR